MSVDIEYRPEAGGQLKITDILVDCANKSARSVASDSEIITHSPSESQARVLLRKDGQPDRRQFRRFEEKQQWQIYGDFGVAEIGDAVCVVNAADVPFVSQHRWYLKVSGQNHYAATGQGLFMHRMLLGLCKGDGKHADHRDGFGLNNWRDNLRTSAVGQNRANARKHVVGSSRFKGVHFQSGKWVAHCGPHGASRYLGRFVTEEEAARAYDKRAIELFHEFASLNFPTTQKAA